MANGTVAGGLYLVADPAGGADAVLPKIEAALRGGVRVLQVWDHWMHGQDAAAFVDAAVAIARPHGVPVLVNENVELLEATAADGIHFDSPRMTPAALRKALGRDAIYGITCGNDFDRVRWAAREHADYVSFCSMFPSPSAGACELVEIETIARARALGEVTIFASGGITPANAATILEAGAHGIAVISGILGAADAEAAARDYARAIHSHPGAEVE